jgi:hypothetical protein
MTVKAPRSNHRVLNHRVRNLKGLVVSRVVCCPPSPQPVGSRSSVVLQDGREFYAGGYEIRDVID